MSLKENKEISEAGGGVGTRARAEGVAAIGPRCESGTSEQGCEARGARETRETSERGRARDTITDPHFDRDPPFDRSHPVTVQKRLEFKLSTAAH